MEDGKGPLSTRKDAQHSHPSETPLHTHWGSIPKLQMLGAEEPHTVAGAEAAVM